MTRRIRNIFFLVTLAVSLCPVVVNAQGGGSFKFLEVLDSHGKPVADAKVESKHCYPASQTTNQKGQLDGGFPVCYGDFQTVDLTISKPGYYIFEDLGLFSGPFNTLWSQNEFRIELLKIPRNRAERRLIGNEQLKREMVLAVMHGRPEDVERLLKAGISPDLNTNDLRGISGPKNVAVVVYAAALADNKVIAVLLNAGADIGSKNSPAKHVLLEYLKSILNPYSRLSRPPAEALADPPRYYEAGFEMLANAGVDLHLADQDGDTALTIAMYRGYIEIFKKMLDRGFNENEKSEALRRLFLRSDDDEPLSLQFAELLLKSGANPNFVVDDVNDNTFNSCSTLLMTAGNKFDFARLLLANGADIDFKCKNGKTALISALEEEKPETARMLLDAGASVNGRGNGEKTALMFAAEKNYFELAEILIDKGSSVNARDFMIETALDLAIYRNASNQMLELLLRSGTDPNGQTSPYCKVPLFSSASSGNLEALRRLIAYKADVNLDCFGNGHTAIVYAVRSGHLEAVALLLEAGANTDGEPGKLAMKYATENLQNSRNNAETIIKMLEAQAETRQQGFSRNF